MTRTPVTRSLAQIAQSRQVVREYLAQLPILDRQVLHHRYSEKMEITVIAREMGISKQHVERILARVRGL